VVKMRRLSCHRFYSNQVRLALNQQGNGWHCFEESRNCR
jgi:hypothetical protein